MLSVRPRWLLFFPLAFALVAAITLIRSAPSALGDDIAAFDVGNGHACVAVGGGLVCWGDNRRGQLGDGTTEDSDIPVEVVGISGGVVSIAAGNFLTCAALASDEVKCWGYGPEGQLGAKLNAALPLDARWRRRGSARRGRAARLRPHR